MASQLEKDTWTDDEGGFLDDRWIKDMEEQHEQLDEFEPIDETEINVVLTYLTEDGDILVACSDVFQLDTPNVLDPKRLYEFATPYGYDDYAPSSIHVYTTDISEEDILAEKDIPGIWIDITGESSELQLSPQCHMMKGLTSAMIIYKPISATFKMATEEATETTETETIVRNDAEKVHQLHQLHMKTRKCIANNIGDKKKKHRHNKTNKTRTINKLTN